jgi:hypothetical protein
LASLNAANVDVAPAEQLWALRSRFSNGQINSAKPAGQRWLGYARINTTAIYAAASGPEELSVARRFWDGDMRAY